MDNSLRALCDSIKKILAQLKPQSNQLSFVIVTGKQAQGKSSLLKQSSLQEITVFSEQHAKVFYNQNGLIVELGETWFTQSKALMQNTIKQLNRCNPYLKITGLALCIDVDELMVHDRGEFSEQRKQHLQLLTRWGTNLSYRVELALVITKMDTLAGFTEFYQSHHASELNQPLGFSLDCLDNPQQRMEIFTHKFHQFIETMGQQVINKMHPARSTIRRSLIRELPIQIAGLRPALHSLLQGISPKQFHVNALYFTSAEQGGVSVDRLNPKIKHEYALVVQDSFPQATNYRAYFVEGALRSIQEHSSQIPQTGRIQQKPLIVIAAGIAFLSLGVLTYRHIHTMNLLDTASKELLAYDALNNQSQQEKQALYHLASAAKSMSNISSNSLSLPTVQQLKTNLLHNTHKRMHNEFVPALQAELENALSNPQNSAMARYEALKAYLTLGQKEHFNPQIIESWFLKQWHNLPAAVTKKQDALLKEFLNTPNPAKIIVNEQLVNDTRNYLNALPQNYLYYSIAKQFFPQEMVKVDIEGFALPVHEFPTYYTKSGFHQVLQQLPEISSKIKQEQWILGRSEQAELIPLLKQAYGYDYVTWWQTFMRKSQPMHYQTYQEGRIVVKKIQQTAAFDKLLSLIQQATKADLNNASSPFNQLVATQFTEFNLMSSSNVQDLQQKLKDVERFIATLAMVQDGGKTAFNLVKARFNSDNASDPVSQLFNQGHQLPEPLNHWTQQLANETWSLLIKDSRQHINNQWQHIVFEDFKQKIAHRYPFDNTETNEIAIQDFNHFFGTQGILNRFTDEFIKPFLDVSTADWKVKEVNNTVMPITQETIDTLIRANIITNMFFPYQSNESKIEFSLQKINLDPVVSSLILEIGNTQLRDNQGTESFIRFLWPQPNARLALDSIEGNHYELAEQGDWALFKLLEKVNVLIDEQDSASLQILFEINSNSGRYLLKTTNQVNPFTPGILNGFNLQEAIV